MKVELIASTPDIEKILYTACTTCYNPGSPIDRWEDMKYERMVVNPWLLIDKVFSSGHLSTSEHINFTFAIEGISRACLHQLVRHRHCSFSQQSQRYVEIKEDIHELNELSMQPGTEFSKRLSKYFADVNNKNWRYYFQALKNYTECIEMGMSAEDARNVLPNATKTNIVLTCNLRKLMHICNERLCTRAQKEIRQLVQEMRREVVEECPELGKYLQPKCEILGYCREHKSCGRKGNLK